MTEPKISELAEAAAHATKRGEWAEALDYYEEIERRGASTAEHVTAMGNCYLNLRQRQDARKTWLRAFEMNPNYEPAVDLLNKNFKGWERLLGTKKPAAAAPPPPPGSSAPPPPPPGSGGPPPAPGGRNAEDTGGGTLNLTVTTIRPGGAAQSARDRAEDRQTASLEETFGRRTPPARQRDDEEISQERTASLRPSPPRPGAPPPGRPAPGRAEASGARPTPSSGGDGQSGREMPTINWEFVMADAMAETGKKH